MSDRELLEGYKQENEQLILKIAQQTSAIRSLQARLSDSEDMIKLRALEVDVSYYKSRYEQLNHENEFLNERVINLRESLDYEKNKKWWQRIFG